MKIKAIQVATDDEQLPVEYRDRVFGCWGAISGVKKVAISSGDVFVHIHYKKGVFSHFQSPDQELDLLEEKVSVANYILLSVCFPCDLNEPIAQIAQSIPADELCDPAQQFLRELSTRTGKNPGGKGGLCQWGIVGSGFKPLVFVQELMPFWRALLSQEGEDSSPDPASRVIVFSEKEQIDEAEAFEIGWFNDSGGWGGSWDAEKRDRIHIRHHDLPFAWSI